VAEILLLQPLARELCVSLSTVGS